jgi:predicted NBD/HSP70 family sugar kinase
LDWQNVPIAQDVEQVFNAPVIVENDARLAALSEGILVKDTYRSALYVTISTGIGGGYIVNGRIDRNMEDMEIGQMLLEHRDRLERWEHFASGRAVYEKYGKRFSEIDDPQTWYVIAHNIALGLINLIATLTPDVVIIGGGAGAHLDKFKERLEEDLKLYENPMLRIPPIIKAQHAEEAVIYGCYDYAKQRYEHHN